MRVLFVGASGFGNLGDDAYRLATARLADPSYELRFDSPYPDERAVDWADALVMGGGGLVYCNDTAHWEYCEMYLQRAAHRKIPIAFCSVGVQLVGNPTTPQRCLDEASQIAPWVPWLLRAESVTVRSRIDAAVMNAAAYLQGQTFMPGVHPDLCYTLARPVGRLRLIGDKASVAVPTKQSLAKWRGSYCDHYEKAQLEGRPYYIVRMSADDTEAVLELEAELQVRRGREVLMHLSAADLVNCIMPLAQDVITGRYHGMVLARAAGVRKVTSVDPRAKSLFEPQQQWSNPQREAREHIAALELALYRAKKGSR